jgi:hypothetical protein
MTYIVSPDDVSARDEIYYVVLPGLENQDYGRGDPLRWPRDIPYQLKLALTSPAGCGRSVDIVRLRTKTTEFSFSFYLSYQNPW